MRWTRAAPVGRVTTRLSLHRRRPRRWCAFRSSGGTPQPITSLDRSLNEASHRWPHLLPGGEAILFAAGPTVSARGWNEAHVNVQSLKSGMRRLLAQHGTYPLYAPTGHLLFLQDGVAYAQRFDPVKLEVTGEAQPLLERVPAGRGINGGAHDLALSATGTLAYLPMSPARRTRWCGSLAVAPRRWSAFLLRPAATPSGRAFRRTHGSWPSRSLVRPLPKCGYTTSPARRPDHSRTAAETCGRCGRRTESESRMARAAKAHQCVLEEYRWQFDGRAIIDVNALHELPPLVVARWEESCLDWESSSRPSGH